VGIDILKSLSFPNITSNNGSKETASPGFQGDYGGQIERQCTDLVNH